MALCVKNCLKTNTYIKTGYAMQGTALGLVLAVIAINPAVALTPTEREDMVAAHNRWRREAGVPAVRWSPAIAASAQQWADHLQQTRNCNMTHSATRALGENLYWASPMRYSNGATRLQEVTPARVTDSWGNEKQDYDYASNTCARGRVCGHYTQVVWRITTDIGCAKAVCGDHSQVWVCNYAPPGNWRGQRPY
jgi:pathogenesis-related protein 1